MTVRDAVADLGDQPTQPFEIPEATEVADAAPEVPADSVLGVLRARAKALREETTVDLDLPGWEDVGLVARYRAVSISNRLGQEVNPIIPSWTAAADLLCSALVEVLFRNEDGQLETLAGADNIHVRYDDDLVQSLGLEPGARTGREVLKALLGGGAKGESRITGHFMAYQGWLMAGAAVASEVADNVVGESPAR